MDGLYNGKPYEQMDDLGGKHHPYFWKHPDRMIEVLEICVFFLGFVVFFKIFSTFFFCRSVGVQSTSLYFSVKVV